MHTWARKAKILCGTSVLGESLCLSLCLCALWDAPQMTQMALVIHERWRSLGSTTLTLTQNGICFVRRARTRLAAARDIRHPAPTTSFCLDILLQTPIHLHSSRLLSQLTGSRCCCLAVDPQARLPGSRGHVALENKGFGLLDAYVQKRGSKAHRNTVAYLSVSRSQADNRQTQHQT